MLAEKKATYVAKSVDEKGYTAYTEEENQVWHDLISRQMPIVKSRGCDEYLNGLKLLNLSKDKIPQCPDVSKVLKDTTGWSLEPVQLLFLQKSFLIY